MFEKQIRRQIRQEMSDNALFFEAIRSEIARQIRQARADAKTDVFKRLMLGYSSLDMTSTYRIRETLNGCPELRLLPPDPLPSKDALKAEVYRSPVTGAYDVQVKQYGHVVLSRTYLPEDAPSGSDGYFPCGPWIHIRGVDGDMTWVITEASVLSYVRKRIAHDTKAMLDSPDPE